MSDAYKGSETDSDALRSKRTYHKRELDSLYHIARSRDAVEELTCVAETLKG